MEDPSDRPIFDPGDIVCSQNGDFAFRLIELIGEGRCCLVYSGRSLRENTKVAVKFFKRGPHYEGAVQREQYILETLGSDPKNNIVLCYGFFEYKGLHCQVMELLEYNIRQIIYRNDRSGLSPWATQKFALDILTALLSLHSHSYVHADLKPANLMWSSYDGCFKLLDFGLTFHTDEQDLHQIQSTGYKAPEVAEWNKYKDDLKRKRKRKLQGTYTDLTSTAPAFVDGLDEVGAVQHLEKSKLEFEKSKIELDRSLEAVEAHRSKLSLDLDPKINLELGGATLRPKPSANCLSVSNSTSSFSSTSTTPCCKDGIRPPPPRLAPPANAARRRRIGDSVDGEEESPPYERPKRNPKTESEKWPSESSGIYTGSIQSREESTAELDLKTRTQSTHAATNIPNRRYSCYGSEESTASWLLQGVATPTISYESWLSSQCSSAAEFGRSESQTSNNGDSVVLADRAVGDSTVATEGVAQEWRRGRSRARNACAASDSNSDLNGRKRCPRPTSICAASSGDRDDSKRRPVMPNEACDMWSFGCLLVEVLTGRKMFSATDKMANILKPLQLLEMKLGPTEIKYYEQNLNQSFFAHAKDLIQRCLMEEPDERISSGDALQHPFFSGNVLKPSLSDMVLLPSSVLQLVNVIDNDHNDEADGETQDVLRDIREEAEKYGRVTEVCRHGAHAYIEFEEASDCQRACTGLTGRIFDGRPVLATFYPPRLWAQKIFVF